MAYFPPSFAHILVVVGIQRPYRLPSESHASQSFVAELVNQVMGKVGTLCKELEDGLESLLPREIFERDEKEIHEGDSLMAIRVKSFACYDCCSA